jgi:exopolyphosphatase/pppGpp-phosphohydrolase
VKGKIMLKIEDFMSEQEVHNIMDKYISQRDHKHEETVKYVALNLFESLKNDYSMSPSDRSLLEYSCMLHDIGYFINKSDHHKHTKYIILHDALFDVIPAELRYDLATLCENHRKSAPKNLENYSLEKKQKFLKLIAILRIADGLDHEIVNNILFENPIEGSANFQICLKSSYNSSFFRKLAQKSALFNEIFEINIIESVLII